MPEAPICHLEPQVDIGTPIQPTLPTLPTWDGTDDGLRNFLNMIKQGYELLAGQRRPLGSAGANNNTSDKKQTDKDPKVGRFVEKSRKTKRVRVENPSNPDQYVMVERTVSLVMIDRVTKEEWVYHL